MLSQHISKQEKNSKRYLHFFLFSNLCDPDVRSRTRTKTLSQKCKDQRKLKTVIENLKETVSKMPGSLAHPEVCHLTPMKACQNHIKALFT